MQNSQSKKETHRERHSMGSTDQEMGLSDEEQARMDRNEKSEGSKISLLREMVGKQEPSSEELDEQTLRRFLHARELDLKKASAMLIKYLKWRRSFVPNGSISEMEIANEIAQNKMFVQGSDKNGQPILIVLAARHFQNKVGGLDEFKRFVVYGLDKACSRIPAGQEKFVAIGDLQGWGYANSDIRGYLAALSILQDYYPERLGKMFLVHVPSVFMAVWKIIYPFIDNKTKKKIVFVENKKLKSTLLEDIDESQIPEIYGGKLPLVPVHET